MVVRVRCSRDRNSPYLLQPDHFYGMLLVYHQEHTYGFTHDILCCREKETADADQDTSRD